MKNSSPVIKEVLLNASVSKVWKAITDKDEMKQWYFDLAEFKPEVGFEFQFNGKSEEGVNYLHLCKITEVIPEKKLTYSWRYDGYAGISYVTFELFSEGDLPTGQAGKTKLKLTHKGLDSFPVENSDFAKENFVAGWDQIIGTSIKEFVEQ
ncbi:MAG: SRPBCC domain-containing protein [Ignavibacteriales bacterium]